MGASKEEISKTILELEKSFNERWSVGDNRGYLDNYAEEISYFDPIEKDLVVGSAVDVGVVHVEGVELFETGQIALHLGPRCPDRDQHRQRNALGEVRQAELDRLRRKPPDRQPRRLTHGFKEAPQITDAPPGVRPADSVSGVSPPAGSARDARWAGFR
nr:hypothetical protein [Streptomyces botrytidirepellens]